MKKFTLIPRSIFDKEDNRRKINIFLSSPTALETFYPGVVARFMENANEEEINCMKKEFNCSHNLVGMEDCDNKNTTSLPDIIYVIVRCWGKYDGPGHYNSWVADHTFFLKENAHEFLKQIHYPENHWVIPAKREVIK